MIREELFTCCCCRGCLFLLLRRPHSLCCRSRRWKSRKSINRVLRNERGRGELHQYMFMYSLYENSALL